MKKVKRVTMKMVENSREDKATDRKLLKKMQAKADAKGKKRR